MDKPISFLDAIQMIAPKGAAPGDKPAPDACDPHERPSDANVSPDGPADVRNPNSDTCTDATEETPADKFLSVYMKHLLACKKETPEAYAWVGIDLLEVFRRSANAFRAGTYSRHSQPVKRTCKELKIKNTREAIDAIFNSEVKK